MRNFLRYFVINAQDQQGAWARFEGGLRSAPPRMQKLLHLAQIRSGVFGSALFVAHFEAEVLISHDENQNLSAFKLHIYKEYTQWPLVSENAFYFRWKNRSNSFGANVSLRTARPEPGLRLFHGTQALFSPPH